MADIIKDNNTLVLRLDKKGTIFTASCSSDGKNFKAIGTADIMLKDIKAGMIACDGVAPARMGNFPGMQQQTSQPETPFEVAYDYFHITNKGLK
jgi:regulation of enolase protein 1 (concanavalin A-like superfamily)